MASPVVVDTNVLVYLILDVPAAEPFRRVLAGVEALACFQVVGEIQLIALRRNWGLTRVRRVQEALARMVIVSSTETITDRWARLMHDQMRRGSRIEVADAWIAATALV